MAIDSEDVQLVGTRQCKVCFIVKPITDFVKAKTKSGYLSYCKSCRNIELREFRKIRNNNEYQREYRRKNLEKVRKYQREYYETNREKIISQIREYQQRNPEKKSALNLVYKAIKRGILIRPDNCSNPKCDNTENIEGHHEDYSKPLEVIWLCNKCHNRLEV